MADTWSVLEGKGDGSFEDISSITMFADYRLPQILAHLGALKYSDELLKKLLEGSQSSIVFATLWSVAGLFSLSYEQQRKSIERMQAWCGVASSTEETEAGGW